MGTTRHSRVNRSRSWVGALLVAGLGHALLAHAAADDSDRIAALEQKLDQSLQLIQQLSARVRDLESRAAQGTPLAAGKRSATAAAATGPPTAPARQHGAPRALFELNFEVGSDGAVGVDLERAQLGYQFADSATVWLGRFHTPYGYCNTAFHHGQQIATSLRRPRFIQFEDQGGVMPAHTVGAWLTGSQRVGEEKVTYDVFIGNSQRIQDHTLDMNNAGNTHGSTTMGGNLGLLLSGALDGLKVGVDVFQTRIQDEDQSPSYVTQLRSYGAYAAYDTDSWEVIAEFHVFSNQDLTGHTGTHHSDAGFVQLGYRAGRYTPYARYERGAFQQSDDFFAAQASGNSYYRTALGLRFDVDLVSSLKLELAETHLTDRFIESYDEALLQYAIRF